MGGPLILKVNPMNTFYAWFLNDPDDPDNGEFMNDEHGDELRFSSEAAAMDYITDDVFNQCIKDGIDPHKIVLVAYELEMH